MKRTLFAAAAAALTLALPVAQAESPPRVVTWNCSGCHGLDGNTRWPQVPRLAGQPAGYLVAQLRAYAAAPEVHVWDMPAWIKTPAAVPAGARSDADARTFMIGMAQAISPAEATAAANWYASRKPAASPAAAPELAAAGRTLFETGLPAKGVLACVDCHGAQGQGLGDFPRLAGQHAGYLVRQLQAFADGRRGHGGMMSREAGGLDAAQMQAVAAYLQGLQ